MAKAISTMSQQEISKELTNFERHRISKNAEMRQLFEKNSARFEELLIAKQKTSGFNLETSLAAVATAAKARRFLCYKDLADANSIQWNIAYRTINDHLWDLVVWSHERFGFMISAIIVNMEHLEDGLMEPSTLAGFVRAAEGLGYRCEEPLTFLRERQNEVFDHFCRS